MKNSQLSKAMRFHGIADAELAYFATSRVIETRELKYFIVQERELSYRFFLHQHPYIQPLMQRLLRRGTSGLLAADTEYAPGEISLPYGVDVKTETILISPIPKGTRVGLLEKVTATDSAGAPVDLEAKDEFKIADQALAKIFAGIHAILIDPMQPTPHTHVTFVLTEKQDAVVFADTLVELTSETSLTRFDDSTIIVPANTKVVLASRTPFEISSGTEVTLLRRRMRPTRDLYADFFKDYKPDNKFVKQPYPVKDLDFTSSGAYGVYNWELFFHVPLALAIQLGKNQRYAEAQRWFHYIFDPTDDSDGTTPERFWKVRPFQYTDVQKAEEILVNLATGADPDLRKETINSIEAWKDAPFRPHVIARYRQQSYMYKTVMAYIDNLIGWGDSLFRQDTGEAIDEALQLFVMAANILGPRPQPVPKKGLIRPQTYANLQKDLKQFGTVMRDMEAALPFDLMPLPAANDGETERLATVRSLGKALYFCVPRNDTLLAYWDTVADRLFKIRNSLNIQGIFRQLALFEPPIDPALLARAAASGLDVGSIVNGLNQPLPLVRFSFLMQKVTEIVQEVKSLGNSLLSAMEKEDGEAMAILRAKHEREVMANIEHVKYAQCQEAYKSKEGLFKSLELAIYRYTYYEQQLGRKPDDIQKSIPELVDLSQEEIESLYNKKFTVQEGGLSNREIKVDIAQDLGSSGGKIVSSYEKRELSASHSARDWQVRASTTSTIASLSHYIPTLNVYLKPLGVGGGIEFGGQHIGPAFQAIAEYQKNLSAQDSYDAAHAGKIASFQKREEEWAHQSNLAVGEINQIFKQLRAAQIRVAIAEQELNNHRKQMKQAEEIEMFLNEEGENKSGKKTNKAFYTWMKREVKGLYAQCFQFAFDQAKKAERACQHELGDFTLTYLQYGYLAGKEGLLAGEKLFLDIKRMEMAYHELNQREYELIKHVSLLQINPLALIQLRATGRCTLQLTEDLFDLDGPGHYFRRIKTMAVSIPCVAGPYASVNCKLTLLKSSIRKTPVIADNKYERTDAEDVRFSDYFGSLQSIVTSSGQNDSGLFETNLRDERYLPFENSGVISEWQLELPANPSKKEPTQFDYDTISDVIFHIRYTAREGGGLLRISAKEHINDLIKEARSSGQVRLFSVRHEFPTEWGKFQSQKSDEEQGFELTLTLRKQHFPYWSQNYLKDVKRMDILACSSKDPVPSSIAVTAKINNEDGVSNALTKDNGLGNLLIGTLTNFASVFPTDNTFKLSIEEKDLKDLWLAVTWGDK